MKEDNKIKCAKISVNVVSSMQENTILITYNCWQFLDISQTQFDTKT